MHTLNLICLQGQPRDQRGACMHAHVMQCVALRESAVDESTHGQKAEHVDPKPNHKKIDSYSSNAMGHAVDSSFHRFLWLLVLSWPMDNAAPQGFNFLIVVSRCKGLSRLFSLLLIRLSPLVLNRLTQRHIRPWLGFPRPTGEALNKLSSAGFVFSRVYSDKTSLVSRGTSTSKVLVLDSSSLPPLSLKKRSGFKKSITFNFNQTYLIILHS